MNIKRNLLIMASAMMLTPLFAQQSESAPQKEFQPYWAIQLQAGAGYTIGEADFGDLIAPAAALSGQYQFKPYFGLRLGVSGWQSKGGWVNPDVNYKYNYVAANLDAMFNLSNALCGWREDRIFNLSAFVGVAYNHAFRNRGAESIARNYKYNTTYGYQLPYLWHSYKDFVVGRAGLLADFRCSQHWSVNIEGNANVLSDHYNSKKADNADWYFNALLGVTYRFGKKADKERVALEPVVLHDTIYQVRTETVTVKEPAAQQPLNRPIFFERNSAKISLTEATKVADVADYLSANPHATLTISGYADANTGTTKINQGLSEQRTKAVVDMLVNQYGIDPSRISQNALGDQEQPFADNDLNRVSICVAE
jgi:outer membrane protein OmpA-like peptidoglycan-associated protein